MRKATVLAVIGIFLIALKTIGLAADSGREVFQVTFGVRPALSSIQYAGGLTDSVSHIVEAPNGDIVVAGNGASSYTDAGSRTHPMVARIDRVGNVLWRQIYNDLADQEVLAFAGKGDEQFIVFKKIIQDQSSLTQPTETLSLRRIDSDGNMSRIIGQIEGIRSFAAAPVENTDLERFVFASIDAVGLTYPPRELRDLRLHEIDLHGNVRRLKFPEGIKGLHGLQHIGSGVFMFVNLISPDSAPMNVGQVDKSGNLNPIIEMVDQIDHPLDFIASESRVFLTYVVDHRERRHRILAHSTDGSELWRYEFEGVDRIVTTAATTSGGLIVSAAYEGNPVVFALSAQGNIEWSQRFSSARSNASIMAIRELSDGWLALAGTTSPGSAGFSSSDSDALLVVADPAGAGLSDYAGCLADAGEIERLRDELRSKTGIEVRREILMRGRRPTPVEELPPLNSKVPSTPACGTLSERDLLHFLQDAVDETQVLNLSKPSDRVKIVVTLRPTGTVEPTGIEETGRFDLGRIPQLDAEHRSGRETIRYIADKILPYAERLQLVHNDLQAAGRMWVGNMSKSATLPAGPNFKEVTLAAEDFVKTLNAQSEQVRQAFLDQFQTKPIEFSANDDVLHLWGDRWLLVGKSRIDDIFDYLQTTLPEINAEILAETERLFATVATRFSKGDPNMQHAEYLKVLQRISASVESLSAEDIAVLRNTFASVQVGSRFVNDMGLRRYRRGVYMKSVAADHVLEFIVENANELQTQEPPLY